MKLAERWLPPLFVVAAFVGAVIVLAPKAPAEPALQHTICLELPLSPFEHVRDDLEACFAEYADRDPGDITMRAWVIIEPVGTTARVVRRSPSPMLDLCVETVLDELGQSEDQHHEIWLDLTWVKRRLAFSHTTRLRYTMPGLWEDVVALSTRAETAVIQALRRLQLAAAMNAGPMTCVIRNAGAGSRQVIDQLRRREAELQRKIAKLRRRAHH